MDQFEKQWRIKLQKALQKIGRIEIYQNFMKEVAEESAESWTRKLMQSLMKNLPFDQLREVVCSCACQTGKDSLIPIQEDYAVHQDLKRAHDIYRQVFLDFIRDYKNLNDEEMQYLIDHNIGSAGILEGNTIIVTKIPKEFSSYLKEEDETEKPYLYCHCPRVRELLKTEKQPLPREYCFCGAGFFKDIWEFILQRPVQVKVIKSLLNGENTCMIEIHVDGGEK